MRPGPATLARLVAASILAAASPTVARAERLAVKSYTTADGLPHDHVVAIAQDPRGFLWFGTGEGLSRFDGYRFTTIGTSRGLPNAFVTAIVNDDNGVGWIATRGGVVRIDASGGRMQVYAIEGDPGANRVRALYRDRRGWLWAGTEHGIFVLRAPDRHFERVGRANVIPGDFWALAFAEDEHGAIWISTVAGLMRYDRDGSLDELAGRRLGLDGPMFGPLLADGRGMIWGGGVHGLWALRPSPSPPGEDFRAHSRCELRIEPGTAVRLPSAAGELCRYRFPAGAFDVTALRRARDGTLWIGTRNQGLLAETAGVFHQYTTEHRLIENGVSSLFEDRDDNLWVGTPSGLMRIQRGSFVSYGPSDGLVDSYISAIAIAGGERVCALGQQDVLQCIRGDRIESAHPRIPTPFVQPATNQLLLQDAQRRWWIRAPTGLYLFPPGDPLDAVRREPVRFAKGNGLPVDHVSRIFLDSRGDLWAGVWDRGRRTIVRRAGRSGAFEVLDTPAAWGDRHVPASFAEDARGNVWIGFFDGGLVRYRGGRIELVQSFSPDTAPLREIRALYLDAQNRLWFTTTQAGLARIDDPDADRPSIRRYGKRDGLSSDSVSCVTDDEWGRIYVGTANGVDQLDPATGFVRHYSAADGLAGGTVVVCARSGGRLWFGSASGLSSYRPRMDRKRDPSAVYIEDVEVDGRPQELPLAGARDVAAVDLAFPGRLRIEFASVGFEPGRGVRYQYRLRGIDGDWSRPTEEHRVNYAGLSPGSYRFEVRAVSAEGLLEPTSASVHFRVVPPWWRQPWFLAALATFTGLAIAAAVRYRIAMLLRVERVRTRIASDLHDDVGATVSRMAILSEVARRQIGDTHADVARVLDEIGTSARELLDTTGDIVWAIDPRKDDGASLVARIREFAAGLLEARGIVWNFQASPQADAVRFDPEQRRQLLLIFKEALHNIVRHARCQSVSIEIRTADGRLHAEIHDNGRGFADAGVSAVAGNGLANMRARAARIGGALTIDSAPNAGTRLILDVPLRRGA